MRYDAAIIGAGADGLTAASELSRAGLRVVVIERATAPGGRCVTREFHPGFFASPFADEVAPMPPEIFWRLGLARRGVLFAAPCAAPEVAAHAEAAARAEAARSHILAEARAPRPGFFSRRPARPPECDWAGRSLDEVIGELAADREEALRLTAASLMGRAADPGLGGSALQLLCPGSGGSGAVRGGLGALGRALADAAREAGAEFRFGLEASELHFARKRVRGLVLADGTAIAADAVISTLDMKRTFFCLFKWSDLPRGLVARAGAFRMTGSAARILIALGARPHIAEGELIHLAQESRTEALIAVRSGTIPERPPLGLRFVSAADPSLAPAGAAVLTATLGCIPSRLFDGAWTHEKRETLRDRAFAIIAGALPGVLDTMLACQIIVPHDIEETLYLAEGDLDGGEIAPDQMFGLRPGAGFAGGRTPVAGLYLAGPSAAGAPLGTGFAGVVAATALLADRR